MKKFTVFFLVYFSFFIPIHADHAAYNYIVSLGFDCEVAYHLAIFKRKQATLPFDWIRTPTVSKFIDLFKNNFEGFTDSKNLSMHTSGHMIYNSIYDVYFVHDFPTTAGGYTFGPIVSNFLDYLPNVQIKYKRRINRLQKILHSRGPVLFIRSRFVSTHEVDSLVKFLSSTYKELEFTFIVVHSDKEIKNAFTMNHVKEFFISQSSPGLHPGWYDNVTWYTIFKDLGLIA